MIAIVIPYYKLRFFKQTLESLENQTDRRFRVYIGNDASPEDPVHLIRETLSTVHYKYVCYEENYGGENLAKQWKRIIAETDSEEWLMILGDDDVLPYNFVEAFHANRKEIENHNISLVKFSQMLIDKDNEILREKTSLPQYFPSKEFLIKKIRDSYPNSLSENIFSRSVYLKYLFKEFPSAWHSDDLAILEFSELKDLFFIQEAVVKVRISGESISGQDNLSKDKQLGTYLFCVYLLNHYSEEFPLGFINLLVKKYREIIWRNGFPLKVNLTKIYMKKRSLKNILLSLKINFELIKRIKSHKN